jgi:predicted  nucleic acid-binding Zn-ribbon protein
MGPTNIKLYQLYQADQALREAQRRLDTASRDVRIQERKLNDLVEKQKLAASKLKEIQAQAGALDLDLKSRDAQIERLRNQQQLAKTNKEYQAFLVEINTAKVDRNKVEDEAIKMLEQVERLQKETQELEAQVGGEQSKLQSMRSQVGDKLASLQAEIESLRPAREEAAAAVPAKARDLFEKLADRYDGEGMSAMSKPDKRREEYVCTACNMDLVADVYNKLHSRDEILHCPSCRRLLYIPEDLTLDTAVHKPKPRKERAEKAPPAAMNRQTSAFDVMKSITPDPDDTEPTGESSADTPEPNPATHGGNG